MKAPTFPDGAFAEALGAAFAAALEEPEAEAALGRLTGLAREMLGDHAAATRPGALKEGERDYRVAGVFAVTPDRRYNMLVANRGFPPEQRRLAIPLGWNHPGEVVRTGRPILLEDTDRHRSFRQFLKTSRMGSSVYFPIVLAEGQVAQIVAAAQARGTYGPADLARLGALAGAAGVVWQAKGLSDWLCRDYPAPDLWRAEDGR